MYFLESFFVENNDRWFINQNLDELQNFTPFLEFTPNTYLFNKYLYLKYNTFSSFFIKNQIDTPSCFNKTYSLLRPSSHLSLMKFVSLLTIHGKKEKYIKFFFKAINAFFSFNNQTNFNFQKKNSSDFFFLNYHYKWKLIFTYLLNIFNQSELTSEVISFSPLVNNDFFF